MGTPDKIDVCIVDDHKIVLEGLTLLLNSSDEVHCKFAAGSGKEALQKLQETPVDVVLLDIEMPEMDGIACCKLISQRYPGIGIIALTMLVERSLIKRMIEAGAEGYLLKNTDREELIQAIKRVYAGKSHFGPEIAEIIVRGKSEQKEFAKQLFPTLSSREKQIVRLIIDEYTTSEIANQLNISFNTVETHRRNIMTKLNAKNTAGIVRIVMENRTLIEE